jgi:putative nucleotidyltransferase with HDIG domain
VPNEPNNVNCLNSRAIIEYIRRHYPERLPDLMSNLPPHFSTMPKPEDFLTDENNWIPSSLVVMLFEKVKEITKNPKSPFDIGFDSIVHNEFSYVSKLFLTLFMSPRSILNRMSKLNANLNNTKTINVIENARGHAVLRWDWLPGVKSSHDVCDYNRGIYSAVPTLWGYAPAKVEENPCAFRGGDHCEISISWGFNAGKIIRFLEQIFTGRKRLHSFMEEMENDKKKLREKVDILKAINDANKSMLLKDTKQVLEETLKPIIEVLGFDRALIMTEDEHREFLQFRYGQVGTNEDLERLRKYRIPLSRKENLMVRVYNSRTAEMSQDPRAMGLNPQNPIIHDYNPGPSIVCPLDVNERTIGILGVTSGDVSRELNDSDKEYVQIFANNIATAYERERLDQELTASYEGTVRALVKAIEVNDPYTRGHSERVASLAVKIAEYLDNNAARLEDIRFGCILHDVGKLGAASYYEWIKKEPLTNEEYERIKEHPVRGEKILMENKFFREFHRAIVRNHHERWDGSGYPDHLVGKQIPLQAQIVAVADAYDAMTTDRPYKGKRSPEEAAAEISRCTGTHFSPTAAMAFMQFYQEQIITGKFEILDEKS